MRLVSPALLPAGTQRDAPVILTSRALRAFGDGYMSLLLPFYLTLLGFSALEVGLLVTTALLGSGAMTRCGFSNASTFQERPAAASVTAVPRSLAAAVSPAIAGYLLALSPFGWPLILCGTLKITYDLLLLHMFRHIKPPEENS